MIEEFAVPQWAKLLTRMTGRHLRKSTRWQPERRQRHPRRARDGRADHDAMPDQAVEPEATAATVTATVTQVPRAVAPVEAGPVAELPYARTQVAAAAAELATLVGATLPADGRGGRDVTLEEDRLTRQLLATARALSVSWVRDVRLTEPDPPAEPPIAVADFGVAASVNLPQTLLVAAAEPERPVEPSRGAGGTSGTNLPGDEATAVSSGMTGAPSLPEGTPASAGVHFGVPLVFPAAVVPTAIVPAAAAGAVIDVPAAATRVEARGERLPVRVAVGDPPEFEAFVERTTTTTNEAADQPSGADGAAPTADPADPSIGRDVAGRGEVLGAAEPLAGVPAVDEPAFDEPVPNAAAIAEAQGPAVAVATGDETGAAVVAPPVFADRLIQVSDEAGEAGEAGEADGASRPMGEHEPAGGNGLASRDVVSTPPVDLPEAAPALSPSALVEAAVAAPEIVATVPAAVALPVPEDAGEVGRAAGELASDGDVTAVPLPVATDLLNRVPDGAAPAAAADVTPAIDAAGPEVGEAPAEPTEPAELPVTPVSEPTAEVPAAETPAAEVPRVPPAETPAAPPADPAPVVEPSPVVTPAAVAAAAAMKSAASTVLAPAVRDEYNRTNLDYRRPMPRPKVRGLVIDFHSHLLARRHAEDWFEAADHYRIDRFLTMSPLEEAVALARDWGHRLRFIAVPQWGDTAPNWADNWLRRIEGFYNLGSRIAKFHASPGTMLMRGHRLDAPAYAPLLAEVRARGMAIMTHIGDPDTWYRGRYADASKFGSRDEHYRMFEGLLEAHRGVPWVGAHLGGNPEDLPRLQRLLDRFPDLMLDCSATRWMVREISARREPAREFFVRNQDRILFGSDQVSGDDRRFDFLASRIWAHRKLWETAYQGPSPIIDPDVPKDEQPTMRGLALPDAVLQKIYHDNPTKLLARIGMGFEAQE